MRCSYCVKDAKWQVIRPSVWGAPMRFPCDSHLADACRDLDDGLTVHVERLKERHPNNPGPDGSQETVAPEGAT